jgi:hypothetical protein
MHIEVGVPHRAGQGVGRASAFAGRSPFRRAKACGAARVAALHPRGGAQGPALQRAVSDPKLDAALGAPWLCDRIH